MFQNKHGKSSKQTLNYNIWLIGLSLYTWTTNDKTLKLQSSVLHKSSKEGLFGMYSWSATIDYHVIFGKEGGGGLCGKI